MTPFMPDFYNQQPATIITEKNIQKGKE